LCGYGIKKISKDLHKDNGVVRAGLSNIYRDIETLTEELNYSVKSSNLVYVLERYGYRKGCAAYVANHCRPIPSNLPAPTYTQFIGREEEMETLLERLSLNHAAHMITVHGIGGVGKTALVLEAARRCLQASCENLSDAATFEAIILLQLNNRN
jgi:LuxR family glucitol operon transcriptional activator